LTVKTPRISVALWDEVGQRTLEEGSRRSQVALTEQDLGQKAASCDGFRGAPTGLGFPQEGLSHFLRQGKFAAHGTPYALRVKGSEPRGGVFLLPRQFGEAGERGFGFFCYKALSQQESLTVRRLQIQASLALPDRGLDLLCLRKRREQCLRLGDLRHFQRRREASEGRREDGVGFGRAAGRLVELGERKRGAQPPTAGALLLCDGDGGLEGFLGRRTIGQVAFQKKLAPRTMQFGFERAKAQTLCVR